MSRRRRRRKVIVHAVPIDEECELIIEIKGNSAYYFLSGKWVESLGLDRWRACYEASRVLRIWPEEIHSQLFSDTVP